MRRRFRRVALTTLPGVEQSPSLSPDGNHVVFAWTGPKQDNQDIYVQMIGSGSPLPLTTDPRRRLQPGLVAGRPVDRLLPQPAARADGSAQPRAAAHPAAGRTRTEAGGHPRAGLFPDAAYLAWSPDSTAVDRDGFSGRGTTRRVVRGVARNRREKAVDEAAASGACRHEPGGFSRRPFARLPSPDSWGAGELHLLPLGKA